MKKILIVDDQPEVRELVKLTLNSPDYLVIEGGNGDEALRISVDELPDLILMDIMMPGDVNGLKATQILKQDHVTQHIPIVILTAKGQKEDIVKGAAVGADDYIVKPFSPLKLICKVKTFLYTKQ